MTPRLSDADLAQIADREQAATEGPWTYDPEVVSYDRLDYTPTHVWTPTRVWTDGGIDPYGETNNDYVLAVGVAPADAEFIAHARTDVPVLLREVKALRGERDAERVDAMKTEQEVAALIEQRDVVARAAVEAVLRLASGHATAAYARGDSDERRRWLDLLIVIERSGYPTETKEEA